MKMKTKCIITILTLLPMLSIADVSDLLITEIAVTPTTGEFIEIYNSGATDVDLTDVYLTDATFSNGGVYYYQIVTGGGGGGGFADFHARFPAGAMIRAGQYQTIALNGSGDFSANYGQDPTYELYEDRGFPDAIPDMLEATPGSINNQGGLSAGEVAVLYSWDGVSDVVQDLDYVLWGDKVEAIDKTGVGIDGPDFDFVNSAYLNDTNISNQTVIMSRSHPRGMSWQRNIPLNEGTETQVGGNGISGGDETSEDLNNTFFVATPTPNIGEYYVGVDTTNALTLRTTVHDIIKIALSVDYSTGGNINDTWHILSEADADPLVRGNMIMVYRNNSLEYFGGGLQTYNREHTWPQSRGFHQNRLGPNNAARTDAHHLMISDARYNSDRGNNYYDNCNARCRERVTTNYNGIGGGSGIYPGNSNWLDRSVFEVWEERKGDVARAMLYMDVRYEGDQIDPNSSPLQNEPDLQLVEDPSELGSGIPKMARLSTLLQWHFDDPVDQTERDRNNVVFGFQGNRNPFVDHPEWVACIFEDICPQTTGSIFWNRF